MGLSGFSAPKALVDDDLIEGFCSGIELVDEWAKKHARKARERGTAVVYVSHPKLNGAESAEIAGFYTLSSHSVARDSLSGGWLKRNAPYDVPTILLGMLGVDEAYQGQGLETALVRDAIIRSCNIADGLGAKALVVQPADASLLAYYERFGFTALPGTGKMALSLKRMAEER